MGKNPESNSSKANCQTMEPKLSARFYSTSALRSIDSADVNPTLPASSWPPVRVTIHSADFDDEVVWEVRSQVVRRNLVTLQPLWSQALRLGRWHLSPRDNLAQPITIHPSQGYIRVTSIRT